MKHIIYGFGGTLLAIILIITTVTISGKMTRKKEITTSLTSALDQSIQTLKQTKKYTIQNKEEFVSDVLQNLLVTIENNSDIKIEIMSADEEKGLLGIKVTEYYKNPNNSIGSTSCSKIVLFDNEEDSGYSVKYTDENGNTYTALNDDTHHLGHTLEQHDLQDADGNTVTVTETTNGDYYFRDDNGTGFTDNGDGTWSDENGSCYTEMN